MYRNGPSIFGVEKSVQAYFEVLLGDDEMANTSLELKG